MKFRKIALEVNTNASVNMQKIVACYAAVYLYTLFYKHYSSRISNYSRVPLHLMLINVLL